MRIIVLTNEYEPHIAGGLGIVATRLAERLASRGHEVTAISRSPRKYVEEKDRAGVRVIRFPSHSAYHSSRSQSFDAPAVLRFLGDRLQRPDIVHIHSIQADELAHRIAARFSCPLVYTCHSLVALEPSRNAQAHMLAARQRRLMKSADSVVSPSRWQEDLIRSRFAPHVRSTAVIPNGAEPPKEPGGTSNRQLIYAGRLVSGKGVTELVKAIAMLQKKGISYRLDIFGSGSATQIETLRKLVVRLGLKHAVRMNPPLPHERLLRVMRRCEGVVVPSRNESFGLLALEAMASGAALVSTRSGGLSDFVDSSVATVIQHADARGIAHAVSHLHQNPGKTRARRNAAYRRARSMTWDRTARLYEGIFLECVSGHSCLHSDSSAGREG